MLKMIEKGYWLFLVSYAFNEKLLSIGISFQIGIKITYKFYFQLVCFIDIKIVGWIAQNDLSTYNWYLIGIYLQLVSIAI